MTSSSFLALLFGSYIICVSVPMVFRREWLISMMDQFIENKPLVFLSGILALMGGLSVIYFHNIWSTDARALITVLGWIAALEGAILIVAPEPLIKFAKSLLKRTSLLPLLGIFYFFLGVYLLMELVVLPGASFKPIMMIN